jgi:hypothetical protein
MKAIIAALAFVTLAVAHAVPALAIEATVTNESNHCAWITYYTSGSVLDAQWTIRASGWSPPKSDKKFNMATRNQVKVRAEILNGPACEGAKMRDVYDRRDASTFARVQNADARIIDNGKSVWIAFK